MKKLFLPALAFVLIAFSLVLIFGKGESHLGQLTVINRAEEPIAQMTIAVATETLQFDGLEPGVSRTVTYDINTDGQFQITGTFKSGKTFQGSGGYVTHGMKFEHEMVVEESGVTLNHLAP